MSSNGMIDEVREQGESRGGGQGKRFRRTEGLAVSGAAEWSGKMKTAIWCLGKL